MSIQPQILIPYSSDERGYSLSRHPANYGKFITPDNNEHMFNNWVDDQMSFIQSLPLETKAGLLLWQRYPKAFHDHLNPLMLIQDESEDPRQLFETIPSRDQIERYKVLIQLALFQAPKLPNPILTYSAHTSKNDLEIGQHLTNNSFLEVCINSQPNKELQVVLATDIPCIYLDAVFGPGHRIILPLGIHLVIQENNLAKAKLSNKCEELLSQKLDPLPNDTLLYLNARKETLEETGVDISSVGNLLDSIDFPLYKQKEYCLADPLNTYVVVPRTHGLAASGAMFICKEDQTILLLHRSYLGDFAGTWACAGGAIGEDRAVVYKSKFFFRSYVYEVSAVDKKIWRGMDLPRLNYEHSGYQWVDYNCLLQQLQAFGSPADYTEEERVTKFLRAYESQIPLAIQNLDYRAKILKKGKFALYIHNPTNGYYELVLPGTAYTLWLMSDHLK